MTEEAFSSIEEDVMQVNNLLCFFFRIIVRPLLIAIIIYPNKFPL